MNFTALEQDKLKNHLGDSQFVEISQLSTALQNHLQNLETRIREMSKPIEDRLTRDEALDAISPRARRARREQTLMSSVMTDHFTGGAMFSFAEIAGDILGISDEFEELDDTLSDNISIWDKHAAFEAMTELRDEESRKPKNQDMIMKLLAQDDIRFSRDEIKQLENANTIPALMKQRNACQDYMQAVQAMHAMGQSHVDLTQIAQTQEMLKKLTLGHDAPKPTYGSRKPEWKLAM